MSMRSVFVAACPVCGYDVARPTQFAPSCRWAVVCCLEDGGCGARGALMPSEGEAVAAWNRPSPGARTLTGAAKRWLWGGK